MTRLIRSSTDQHAQNRDAQLIFALYFVQHMHKMFRNGKERERESLYYLLKNHEMVTERLRLACRATIQNRYILTYRNNLSYIFQW